MLSLTVVTMKVDFGMVFTLFEDGIEKMICY